VRTATRTAVIAGTATAVSGRVASRQQGRASEQAAEEQAAAYAAPAPPPPPPEAADYTAELNRLAQLHAQGVLTDEEFTAKKAQILGL
jgi:multidrug resistance efflux pump